MAEDGGDGGPPEEEVAEEELQATTLPTGEPKASDSGDHAALQEELLEAEDGRLEEFLAGDALVKSYSSSCETAGLKVSHLVERCLRECTEANRETFYLEAPGNHEASFSRRLGDGDVIVFTQVFSPPLPFLSRLDLSYNQITDDGAIQLASGFLGPRAKRLTALSLRSNSIGPVGCSALCGALSRCPTLQRLDLSQNPLGKKGGLMLVELLRVSPALLELLMADTEANIDVLVSLAATLLTFESNLKVCDIQNPRINTLQEDHTIHLGRMLRVNTHISELYLGKHKFRDDGIRQLVDFLLENKVLRVLDLRCNELGAEGAHHLGKLLASDCQLLSLNLNGNRIGEKGNSNGAKALAEGLMNNTTLRHLDLNHNMLSGPALELLGAAVEQSRSLEVLELFHSHWDQASSYKFHQILNHRSRALPLKADFVTSEVDLRIDICKVDNFDTQ
mmetsp:Transcript_26353/g.46667  ORF Transcript_26353/g.46667 Transcript_26353/m.46667 type:complete len:449 (-) Transcript_26353:55-1401(-)